MFVELHIQPHITSSHGLLGKLADLLDCLGSFLLECAVLINMALDGPTNDKTKANFELLWDV